MLRVVKGAFQRCSETPSRDQVDNVYYGAIWGFSEPYLNGLYLPRDAMFTALHKLIHTFTGGETRDRTFTVLGYFYFLQMHYNEIIRQGGK